MTEISDKIIVRFIQHLRHLPWFLFIVNDLIDPAAAMKFIVTFLLDDATEITPFVYSLALLDDPAIHVDDVQTAIRSGSCMNGPEQWICRSQELRTIVTILEKDLSLVMIDLRTTNDPAHRLGYKKISVSRRHLVAEIDLLP